MVDQKRTSTGLTANQVLSGEAITISRGNCINGSGTGHFGGADTWPYLCVKLKCK